MEVISNYFPGLTALQQDQYAQLLPLYKEWNTKINVISRKDIDHLYERHVLHSLGIGRVVQFNPRTRVVDIGTGGGFPGIPLAIMFPETHFHLVDSIGKKITVVHEISTQLGLTNVSTEKIRGESLSGPYDFIVSRAVTALPDFVKWVRHLIAQKQRNSIENGILYIKGGDFQNELKAINMKYKVYPMSAFYKESFFETKSLLHLY